MSYNLLKAQRASCRITFRIKTSTSQLAFTSCRSDNLRNREVEQERQLLEHECGLVLDEQHVQFSWPRRWIHCDRRLCTLLRESCRLAHLRCTSLWRHHRRVLRRLIWHRRYVGRLLHSCKRTSGRSGMKKFNEKSMNDWVFTFRVKRQFWRWCYWRVVRLKLLFFLLFQR